ncbi:FOG: Transposase [Streptomyces chartreusis NRRL 3882]|uniref:FOG: Transposase n=1 Tax=Streptomyces chartreusis NRRL 3882 TaxID=1079985 RepID=A0A2N9B070_STRCX|nr:FOG: Transposase [Streptomyces chartreusis NRRL 3882]
MLYVLSCQPGCGQRCRARHDSGHFKVSASQYVDPLVSCRPRRLAWHREERRHWVLARRSVSRPEEISHYVAYCPADTTLDELIRIAGSRSAVEEWFQTGKQECGLDDYRVRRYPGWRRHITLAMPAHARLTGRRPTPQRPHPALVDMAP